MFLATDGVRISFELLCLVWDSLPVFDRVLLLVGGAVGFGEEPSERFLPLFLLTLEDDMYFECSVHGSFISIRVSHCFVFFTWAVLGIIRFFATA